MTRPRAHAQLNGGVPPEGYERNTVHCHHHAHGHIGYTVGIRLATLELEAAVITRQETSEADEHLAQRGVNVEIKLALEVVRPKFAKVGLVPDHQVCEPDFMKTRPAGEEGVYRRWNVFRVLLDKFGLVVEWYVNRKGCCGDGTQGRRTMDVGGGEYGLCIRPLLTRPVASLCLEYTSFPSSSYRVCISCSSSLINPPLLPGPLAMRRLADVSSAM